METGGEGEEPISCSGFPFWIAARRRFKPDDPFFAAGNVERELLAKQVALDLTEDERHQFQKIIHADINIFDLVSLGLGSISPWYCTVFCPIVGCGAQLNCLEDFEDHYHARHTASCSTCFRVYPTSRLLSIHVSEAHDSFFQAKVARGFPMYECLVEGCGVKLKSYKGRKQHLIDKHRFPKSFEFFRKSRPSKRQRQKNQHRQVVRAKETDMDVDEKNSKHIHQRNQPKQAVHRAKEETEMDIEDKMDDLTSAVSKLSTSDSTPSSVSFGHRHSRGFAFVPRSVRQSGKPDAQPDAKG